MDLDWPTICAGAKEFSLALFSWLGGNAVGLLGIAASVFIGYHVYYLSSRLGLRGKLERRAYILSQVQELLDRISKGSRSKVELINVRRYPHDYLGQNTKNKYGYAYLAAELKSFRFDGVEFFCDVVPLYHNGEKYSVVEERNSVRCESNAFTVGVVPYDWIEYVDRRGDEYSYRPQFFVRYEGPGREPYKYFRHYRKSDTFEPGSDPRDMQWVSLGE